MKEKEKKETKSEIVPVRVTPTVKKKLEAIAKRRVRTLGYVASAILTNYVKQ